MPPGPPKGSGQPSAPRESVAVDETVPPYNYDDAARDTDADGVMDPADRCPTERGQNDANGGYRGCPKSHNADSEPDEPAYRYDDPSLTQVVR
jgi:hypothetical protein